MLPREEKKEKGRGTQKGQEISVTSRQHPVNSIHVSLCDIYSVSVKLKPESITKKNMEKSILMPAATILK